jgi:hypothetical protein
MVLHPLQLTEATFASEEVSDLIRPCYPAPKPFLCICCSINSASIRGILRQPQRGENAGRPVRTLHGLYTTRTSCLLSMCTCLSVT